MLTRPIPSTGEQMQVVGLGTWPVFDVGGDERSRAPLPEVVRLLVEAGGMMIDTSPMYGRSEGVVGDIVAGLRVRERVFLATKVWISGESQGAAQMARSAALLKSPVVDLMQVHNLVDWRTQLATMRDMKARGTLRYIGITHYTTGALSELVRILESENAIDFVQLGYSLATREPETRLLPIAAERGVAVIVNQPLERGTLFRHVRGRALPDWAAEFDCASWAQLFLKYLLGDPAVLLLDEPVNGLDPEGIRWIRHLMQSLAKQGRTVLVSSHLINEIAHTAEALIVIGQGRLLAQTTVAQLSARTGSLEEAFFQLTDGSTEYSSTYMPDYTRRSVS